MKPEVVLHIEVDTSVLESITQSGDDWTYTHSDRWKEKPQILDRLSEAKFAREAIQVVFDSSQRKKFSTQAYIRKLASVIDFDSVRFTVELSGKLEPLRSRTWNRGKR